MKLRQALKIYSRVDTPRERPWKQNTVGSALRRYQKTDTSRKIEDYWEYLMRLRRQQLADEDFCNECGTEIGHGHCLGCHAVACSDDGDYDVDEWDDDEDYWEEAAQECGLLPKHLGGGCTLGGTEHCDFECPFRDQPHLMTGEDEPDSS